MRRLATTLACALAGAACGDDVGVLSLSGLEDDLLVIARVGPDRALLEAKIVDAASPVYFPAGEGDTLHVFAVDKDKIRDAEGRALDAGALAELTIATSPDRGCGCAFPAEAAPFVLEPGSRCAVPPFFEHRASSDALAAEDVEAIRSAISIERPGACDCPRQEVQRALGSFETCDVDPAPKPHRWHQIAISNDGGIAAIHPSMLLTASAGGAPVFHPLETSFVRSPILAGIGASGRRFLGAGRTQTVLNDIPEESFVRFDGDAIEVFDLLREPAELAMTAVFDPTRSSVFLFGPSLEGNEARVWRCNEALTSCTGRELPPCGPDTGPAVSTSISNATALPSGDVVAMTVDAHLYHLPAGSDEWVCRVSDLTLLRLQGPLQGSPLVLLVAAFDHAVLAGGRLFACGHGRQSNGAGDLYSFVVSAELSLAEDRWHAGEISLYAEENPGARCQGLWHDARAGEVLAFFTRDQHVDVLAFEAAGPHLDRREGPGLSSPTRPARFPGFDEPVALVSASPDGRNILIAGIYGGLRVERDQGALVAVGGDAPKQPAFAVAQPEGALLFGGGSVPHSWDGGCDAASVVPRPPLGPTDAPIEAVAGLPDGRTVVLSRRGVAIYDAQVGVVSRSALDLPVLKAAAAITGDELVLLDADGAAHVLSLSEARLRSLPIDAAPGVASDRPVRFEYLSGSRGLGWLTGGVELARVRRGPEGLRAELWWGARIAESLREADELLVVDSWAAPAMLCGGGAVIFVRMVLRNINAPQLLARSVLLEPRAMSGYEVRVAAGFSNQARFGGSSFGLLATRMSSNTNAVMGFGNGLLLRPDSEPWYAPNPDFTSILEVDEHVVLTDRAGLRVFLRSP